MSFSDRLSRFRKLLTTHALRNRSGLHGRILLYLRREQAGRSMGEPLVIESNTQEEVGDVRIGAGNFWDREYTDDRGRKLRGPTAMLWIYVRNAPEQDRVLVVHPGQEFRAGNLRLRVESVDGDSVTLLAS